MSIEQYVKDPHDPDLLVYSELVTIRRFAEFSTPGNWRAELQVLRFRDVIFRRIFSSKGRIIPDLDNELSKLYLQFPEKPHGLHFRFRFSITDDRGRLVDIFVVFDGLISHSFKRASSNISGRPSGLVSVKSKLPRGILQRRITSVVRRTRNTVQKQMNGGPKSSKLPTPIRGGRPSPELRDPTTFKTIGRSSTPGSDVDGSQSYSRYQREYSSQRTPNFRSIRKKDLHPLPYHMLLSKFYDDGGYTVRNENHGPGINGFAFFTQSVYYAGDFSDFTTLKGSHNSDNGADLALARLANKANNGSANIPEDLFTMAQTISLFTNNTNRLRFMAQALKDGASLRSAIKSGNLELRMAATRRAERTLASLRRSGINGTKLLAEMWLELRYGWMPLINDIQESIKVYSDLVNKSTVITSLTASATTNVDFKKELLSDAAPWEPTVSTGMSSTRRRTKTKYCVRYKLSDPYLHAAAQLGFTSPVGLAWELIPFSFVVDWFYPIGNALQLLHAFEGLEFVDGYRTQFTRTITTVNYSYTGFTSSGDLITSHFVSGRGSAEAYLHDRVVLADFPRPGMPTPKNPVSVIHAANAAALLVKTFLK